MAWSCEASDDALLCISGGVCAHPDTPIATPEGERRIADLRMGDLVYSRHRHQLVAVPLLRVTRRPVTDHAVVDLTLSNGERLLVSGGHPTAEGRRFADLTIGSTLGDQVVQAIATRHYDASHTYDILPDSDSGTYVAAGALIGSTLWDRDAMCGAASTTISPCAPAPDFDAVDAAITARAGPRGACRCCR